MFTTIENLKTLMNMCMCSYQEWPTGPGAGNDDTDTSKMEEAIDDSTLSLAELEELKNLHTTEEIGEFFAKSDKLINVDDDALNAYMECINAYYAGQTEAFDTSTTDRSNLGGDIEAASAREEFTVDEQTDGDDAVLDVVVAEGGDTAVDLPTDGNYVEGTLYNMPDGSTARQEGGVLMTVTPAPAADVNLGTVEGGVAVDQGGYGATGTVETVVAEASPSIPADLGSVMQEGTILGHTDGKQYVVRDGAWAYHGETPTAEVDLGTVQGGATVDQGGYGATGTVETVVAGPRRLADHEPTGVTIRNDDGSYENLTCARYREVFKEDYNDVLARERKAAEIAKARPVSLSQMSGVALGENVSNPEAVLASIEASHKSADQMIAMLTASSDVEQMESKMQEARAGGYNVLKFIKFVLGKDVPSAHIQTGQKLEAVINGDRAKFNRAADAILQAGGVGRNDSGGLMSKSEGLGGNNNFLIEKAAKILPWAGGVYLADIPLPFWKKAFPGADMAHAKGLMDWVRNGMPGEFDINAPMETGVGLLSNLQGLRGAMGNLTPEDAAAIESKQYHKLSGKLQDVIMTYFDERLIPDLGALRENGFAMLEVLDDKYGASGDAISELQSAVDREDANSFFPLADKVIAILREQDGEGFATFGGLYAGDNADYLTTVSQRNTYMKEVQGHDRVISKYAGLKDTNPEMANLITPMLAFRSAENFIQAYGIPDVYAQGLRKGVIDFNSAPAASLPTYKEMFIALSDSNVAFVNFKQRAKYARTGLVEDNSGNATMQMADGRRLTAAPFGPRLNDMSQAGVVQALERTQTGQGRNSIDAIETKLQLAGIHNVDYNDIVAAVGSGHWVDISSIPAGTQMSNTANPFTDGTPDVGLTIEDVRAGAMGFEKLFQFGFSKEVRKFMPNGQEVTLQVQYSGYIKPDCANPVNLQINDVICTHKQVLHENGFPTDTMGLRRALVPLVIPYHMLGINIFGGGGNPMNGADRSVPGTTGPINVGGGVGDVVGGVIPR